MKNRKLFLLTIWTFALAAFLPAAGMLASGPSTSAASAPAVTEDEYAAILMDGKKVGHARHLREVDGGTVTTTHTMKITISRGAASVTATTVERSVETADGRPLAFKTVQDLGIMATTVEGSAGEDGNWTIKSTSGGVSRERVMSWPQGALLNEGARLLSLRKGIKEGTSYPVRMFDTSGLRAMDANVTIGPRTDVDLFGRVVKLTEVTTVISSAMGRLTVTSYVDEKLDALRTIMPVMGMNIQIDMCTKEFALSPSDPADFFDRMILACPAPLKDLRAVKEVRYTLQPTGKGALDFIATDEQSVRAGEGNTVILTIRPVPLAAGEKFPYSGSDANLLAAIKPTRFLQSDDKRVAELAKQAVAGAKDSAEAVRNIERFVRRYIHKKDLSVGYASAAEVAESRQGDCTEHAVLAAAMCRAAGIPAQVVVGMAYVPALGDRKDVFGPHAWARARVGAKWVSLDAALDGFDAGHITMACGDGEPADFFGIVNLLGNIKIVEVQETR